ncbi:hypothetical protein N2152v2_009101 [Parachlorella kessleri]
MGGSLRRKKKHRPRIVKRGKKEGLRRSKVPEELTAERPDFRKKLGASAEWDAEDTVITNYQQVGLVRDPNAGFGRNKRVDIIQEKAEDPAVLSAELDDDLKAACNEQRSSGKAPPKRLTPHQRQIVQRLLNVHGDDTRAMMMDRTLNPMQHSEGTLQQLIDSYCYWKSGSGVDFRVPVEGL